MGVVIDLAQYKRDKAARPYRGLEYWLDHPKRVYRGIECALISEVPPGVAELRDENGNVLVRFVNIGEPAKET
jgi:hypothetical protein